MERLGPGRIEFLYDNQSLCLGPALIEHGNRHDCWNKVRHDELRQVRSALSRREEPSQFHPAPGSELVVQVMNEVKVDYPFVDLLKPETEAVLPLLAVLKPDIVGRLGQVVTLFLRSLPATATPRFKVGADVVSADAVRANSSLASARELAGASRPEEVGAINTLRAFALVWREMRAMDGEAAQLDRLYRGIQAFFKDYKQTFDVCQEVDTYLSQARTAAQRGFKAVVFGHTHLAKRISLANTGAVYMNSGTWADLMWMPAEIFEGGDIERRKTRLREFADAAAGIGGHNADSWRRIVPSFVRLELGPGDGFSASLEVFRSVDRQDHVNSGILWSVAE